MGRDLIALYAAAGALLAAGIMVSCTTSGIESTTKLERVTASSKLTPGGVTEKQMFREIRVVKRFIPKGRYGRKVHRAMKPRYITIHSTQNYDGDAWDHARALERGKLRAPKRRGVNRIGYLTWHFTVQQDVVMQHLPTNEQGEHADFDGVGNNYSIGIEMCEHRGNSRAQTLERTAKLCASLMRQYNLPLRSVVPHYHWPRKGLKTEHKNCPHYLMTNGRPGRKWNDFLQMVKHEHERIYVPAQIASRGFADAPEKETVYQGL